MRRLVVPVLGLIVLVAAFLATLASLSEGSTDVALVLTEVAGEVTITDAGLETSAAQTGIRVNPLDRVATGEDARAVLELGHETRIRLGPVSSIQVNAVDEEGVEIELEEGALQATVRPDSGSLRLSSRGREALITDGDISMGVLPDEMLLLESTRGDAMLAGIIGASLLQEGERLVVGREEHAEIGRIPEELLLAVQWPENPRTRKETMEIPGKTEPGARVRITGSAGVTEVRADEQGAFRVEVSLYEGENPVRVEAVDLLGNSVEVRGVLERDQSGPTFRGGVEYGP
ncbi:MAG: FecR domain-containing protein [Deltaproteobacteria bacterium]|nr:FecR domain-containing protein [Deltaproteobacteria bacterium]